MPGIKKIIEKIIANKHEIFTLLFSIVIFMVLQTVFFNEVISKEYNEVLNEKMNSIKYFISNNKNLSIKFDEFKTKYLKKNEKKAKEQENERDNINKGLYIIHCVIPILVVFVITMIIFFVYLTNVEWTYIHILNIFLIFIVYIPEIIIYFFVVKKYQYIGNTEIIYKLYDKINTNNDILNS